MTATGLRPVFPAGRQRAKRYRDPSAPAAH
jgi:hypothetical protein